MKGTIMGLKVLETGFCLKNDTAHVVLRKGVPHYVVNKGFAKFLLRVDSTEVVDKYQDVSVATLSEGGDRFRATKEWTKVPGELHIVVYDGGEQYTSSIPAGMEVKVISYGNPRSAALWGIRTPA